MNVSILPAVNALLNTVSTVLLVIGYLRIRAENRDGHRKVMLRALGVSALFLTSYLVYHYAAGSVPYQRYDWTRPVYFAILIPHIILAAVNLPFILIAVTHALRGKFDKHKRIAKYLFPSWLFVSVSGVLVYLMLYHLPQTFAVEPDTIVLTGGRIVDLSDYGNSGNDIDNAMIVIHDGIITYAGPLKELSLAEDAFFIDTDGTFIMPGLIDGFAAINNRSYANAYLYSGVTSIIGVSGGRRGPLFTEGDPGTAVYRLESIGEEPAETDAYLRQIEELHTDGVTVLLVMYEARGEQLPAIAEKAHSLGMAVIGELGHAAYAEGIDAGFDAFVHTTRYSLNAVPETMQREVADEPFSDELDSPKWRYYTALTELSADNPGLLRHAERLGNSGTALMPTLSLLYLDQEWSVNPWGSPVAAIIDPDDVNAPADPETGKHTYDPAHTAAYAKLAKAVVRIESLYRETGATYIAGSATDVWGTMPGISLHTELEGLRRIGLTNRQALAAATDNFAGIFGWKTGRIAEGYRADILVLDKNPLDGLHNLDTIRHIIINGETINRENLLLKQER